MYYYYTTRSKYRSKPKKRILIKPKNYAINAHCFLYSWSIVTIITTHLAVINTSTLGEVVRAVKYFTTTSYLTK